MASLRAICLLATAPTSPIRDFPCRDHLFHAVMKAPGSENAQRFMCRIG